MDKIRTSYKGGMPALQEHFSYMQEAYGKAFEAIVKSFNYDAPGYILWGCQFTETSSNYTIEPGAIVLDGEILLVNNHTIAKDSSVTYYWDIVETDDPEGEMQFYDGNTYNVYAKRRGKVKSGGIPTGINPLVLGQEPRLPDLIDNLVGGKYVNKGRSWHSPNYINGWSGYSGTDMAPVVYNKKDDIVHIEGYVKPEAATSEVMAVLPVSYRPAHLVRYKTPEYAKNVRINPAGEIKIVSYATTDTRYYLNISFYCI